MPIYEYRCRTCGKTFSVLTLRVSERVAPACTKCGSRAADRLLSRFAMPKSDAARLDALADPSRLGDLDESDPKRMARWMRRMGREMGENVEGGDLDEMLDAAERGTDGESNDDGAD